MLLVFRGKLEDGEAFFSEYWPQAKAIADPTGELFELFGLYQVSLRQLFGLPAIWAVFRSFWNGNRIGPIGTDPMRSPGLFVIGGESILWSHFYSHVGDHPDFRKIPTYF